jgi:hypothetical protein
MNFYSNTFSHPFLLYGWLILRTTIFCDHLFAYENVPIALRICRRYQNQHKQLYTSEGVAHIWCLLQTFNRASKEIAALRYILWHDFCWTICGVPNLSSVRLLVLLVGAWNLIWYHRIRVEVLGSSLGFCSLEKKNWLPSFCPCLGLIEPHVRMLIAQPSSSVRIFGFSGWCMKLNNDFIYLQSSIAPPIFTRTSVHHTSSFRECRRKIQQTCVVC